ncbi:hypothetical protein Neosp_013178 [[Neocosmospora] mangrovei]
MRTLSGGHEEKASFQVLIASRDPPPDAFTAQFEVSVAEARASSIDLKAYVTSELQNAFPEISSLELSKLRTTASTIPVFQALGGNRGSLYNDRVSSRAVDF